jgi:hypothetical protein
MNEGKCKKKEGKLRKAKKIKYRTEIANISEVSSI